MAIGTFGPKKRKLFLCVLGMNNFFMTSRSQTEWCGFTRSGEHIDHVIGCHIADTLIY